MAEGYSGGASASIPMATEARNDETLETILKELVNHFDGPGDHRNVASITFNAAFNAAFNASSFNWPIYEGCEYNSFSLNSCCVQRALITLRLQYLHLFTLHYPIDNQNKSFRNFFLYTEFGAKVKELRKQIRAKKVKDYSVTLKHLIHLTEVIAGAMIEHEMLWYSCWRCGVLGGNPTSVECPLLRCLSKSHDTPIDVISNLLGIPTSCTCPSQIYHCKRAEINYNN